MLLNKKWISFVSAFCLVGNSLMASQDYVKSANHKENNSTEVKILKWSTRPFGLKFDISDDSNLKSVKTIIYKGLESSTSSNTEQNSDNNSTSIKINSYKTYQKIEAFGAALTETAVLNILKLPENQQLELIRLLFAKKSGAALNIVRVPMGASDLSDGSKGEYTYNDTEGNTPDPYLKNFNMDRDLKTLKVLKMILSVNPDVKVMINPWTAPPWMKDNKSYYRGYFESKNMESLALYFLKTINVYHKHGIEVHYVGIQNEPGISVEYPSMLMSDDQQADFIKLLGEKLKKLKLKAQIIANDDNYVAMSRVQRFINDPEVNKHIGVAGFHCWSNDSEKAKELPSRVTIFETECGGNINSFNFGYDFYWWLNNRIINGLSYGLSGIITWNMVSDEQAGPHGAGPQGCRTCRGLVVVRDTNKTQNSNSKSPSYYLDINSEFRALMHASKFIKRGAYRIHSEQSNNEISQVAIKNPDGTIVLILGNSSESSKKVTVNTDDKTKFTITLEPGEATSLVF